MVMPTHEDTSRFNITAWSPPDQQALLQQEVLTGLSQQQKVLPAKLLYDEAGSAIFDAICRTPEYYPTRTELAVLEAHAEQIVAAAKPEDLIELGSGMARKTHTLLDAAFRAQMPVRYVPLDISESAARASAEALLERYPSLNVHCVIADFHHGLEMLPRHGRRLVAFLGGTIGNFDDEEASEFLAGVRCAMGPEDCFLLGTDLVKDPKVLHAAYNDAAGHSAAFNQNVLNVLNNELDAHFRVDTFEPRAFYNEPQRRIEMHMVSKIAQSVRIGSLDWSATFRAGESIRTEISRKFTRDGVSELMSRAGFELSDWYPSDNDYFALSLSRPKLNRS